MKKFLQARRGFTLIEILLVVAAIAILAGIVILAINPSKQLGDTRNAQRHADVTTILNAVYQYYIDNGSLPAGIPTSTPAEICRTTTCTSPLVDLGVLTANEKYLTAIPADPTGATTNGAGYEISRSANNRVTVTAPDAEQSATISVTR
jgi:prepilin-type N-terminal cleavage/methylation domain-containing protein